MLYTIESKGGVVYGVYEGDSEHEAFMTMLRDAGSKLDYGAPHVGTEGEWIIYPAAWHGDNQWAKKIA